MRIIGHLAGEKSARAFSDFLYLHGIENQVEAETGESWAVWIHAEDEMLRARGFLADFLQNPRAQQFQKAAGAAEEFKEQQRQERLAYEKRLKKQRHLFQPLARYGMGMVTFLLICLSGGVFINSHFGQDMGADAPLFITSRVSGGGGLDFLVTAQGERLARPARELPEIRRGQIWRLVTPIFIHFTLLHILFNMLWLWELGSMIEARQGSLLLLVMVLAVAVAGNLAQYLFSGPMFGGMSGVVYGLLGYIWIRGKLDPGSGLYLHPTTVAMMIGWFILCALDLVGHVANATHAAGLFMGMGWGFLSSLRHR